MIGKCLCGRVAISLNLSEKGNEKRQVLSVCHCSICRRQTAGPEFFLAEEFQASDFQISGEINQYHSSNHASRAFCPNCGTAIYWKDEKQQLFSFTAGLFDLENPQVIRQYFLENKPSYYEIIK